jgi:hypothetical protein
MLHRTGNIRRLLMLNNDGRRITLSRSDPVSVELPGRLYPVSHEGSSVPVHDVGCHDRVDDHWKRPNLLCRTHSVAESASP